MADEERRAEVYVFSVDAVRRAITSLLKSKNHEHVPGYLALLRSPRRRQGEPSSLSDIVDVYDRYLKVLDAGENKPYLRPFVSRGSNIWFNDNISGSYAPSNVKAEPGMFFKVAEVSGTGLNTTYSLPEDHVARASEHLLKGHRLPIIASAAFFYRDYGFQLESPSIEAVGEIFRNEFGLDIKDVPKTSEEGATGFKHQTAFEALFHDDTAHFAVEDLEILRG